MQDNHMLVRIIALTFLFAFSTSPAEADGMTYQRARQRVPDRQIPEFWIGDVKGLPARFAKLTEGKVTTVVTSPGGRPMHLIEYGRAEKLESKANFNSAIGARELSAYMDKTARERPVILLVGPDRKSVV